MRRATTAIVLTVFLTAFSTPALVPAQTPFRGEGPTLEDLPAIGHRYRNLSRAERAVLRPSFRLPLRALFEAEGTEQLLSAAIVEPLPDPDRPLLPTPADPSAGGDPFGDDGGAASDRGALGALGELFALEAELLRASGRGVATARPSSAALDEPYQTPPEERAAPDAAAEDDPFASSDDPDDDPFGF